MNKQIFILAYILFWASHLLSAQNFITFGGEKNKAIKNMYLSEGYGLSVGYQYHFQNNLYIASAIKASVLKKNKDYSFDNEPNMVDLFYLPLFSDFKPQVLYGDFNINLSLGYHFLSTFRIRPVIAIGLSVNYIDHEYSEIIETKEIDGEGFEGVQVNSDQVTLGIQSKAGLIFNICSGFNFEVSATLKSLPFVEVGIQKKNVSTYGWQVGISRKIGS